MALFFPRNQDAALMLHLVDHLAMLISFGLYGDQR